MNPQDNSNQQGQFSLNRNAPMQPAAGQPTQPMMDPSQMQQPQQQQFVPFASFPANQRRDYDMGIKQMVIDLVERKYCPTQYIARYEQMSAQDPAKFPPLDENTKNIIRASGPDISPDSKEFEINRVYNKLEIEIFELSTYQLPADKQEELKRMTEAAQTNPANQGDMIMKIREFMQGNVPNITMIVDEYMRGFMNQYLAGRY